ncbi:glycosyltransferase family 62 protein [Wickerhamomyces anomalus NRRL Y-366-8]|uniref:Glycosyltransferase family 62 protein n=1 Tax=Wickerhamomyces anomalus (strain ATCC 58044 / CBS 1984 / NCYC 433 / NRRL Y-366-8) TaxID=683960 RepID=A0A1E3P2X6_WICAA|nr:glycosyltransferase family 62 protein [Wickerhamomyces anomalus NRRL Y-366-8]ODQ59554.1 glycosyltransferase family 62 protein [Wickerhamomyces anomalus NRRL Y-366-8]
MNYKTQNIQNQYINRFLSITKNKYSISIIGVVITLIILINFIVQVVLGQLYVPNFSSVPSVDFFDLKNYEGLSDGWQHEERVLFCVPLRDAAAHLPMFFGHMKNLTYPHNLIDLSFLVSDSSDDTMEVLKQNLKDIQTDSNKAMRFGEIEIFEKDFGQVIGQGFSDRHGFEAQGPRRKLMARARNWLWTVSVKPYHSWVYWRDADVETVPPTILEDLMHHGKDVIVPNVWRPLPDWLGNQQPYDLNSWQESEGGLQLAKTLGEDAVIVEGYVEYATWRPHLAYLRDPYGDPEVEMDLDGIGGVSILARAKVFKTGAGFPAFSFEKHAETEAFGKLCKRMGYSVAGLPHYVIWHIYEPSSDDLKHMEWMAKEEARQLEESKLKQFYDKIWSEGFEDVREDWKNDRINIFKNTDTNKIKNVKVDWSDADNFQYKSPLGKDKDKVLAAFDPSS